MIQIGLVSLGCAKNLVDSENILAMFPKEAFSITSDPKKADLIIVNTCGFIASAKKESIDTILEMASYGKKLAVVGCLAQRYLEELRKEIPEADLILPISSYPELHKYLTSLLGEEVNPFSPLKRVLSTGDYSAYLKISEGCDNFCAFCAIPFIRGRFVSRPFEEIIEEAKTLKEKGIKEISLVSQDTTVYGKDFPDKKPNIVDLLNALEDIGFYSIRLLYLYPSEISDELIDKIASSKQIAHYFDIPVQSGSDHVLTLMRRHDRMKDTVNLFAKIRKKCPDAILRTTLIAGFAGETEDDHQETLSFIENVQFDKMGCFTYSPEEGTLGYTYKEQVDEKTKKRRKKELMLAQRRISLRANKKHIGETMEGLVVGYDPQNERYALRSYWAAPDEIDGAIWFTSPKPLKEGEIVKVHITDALIYDLLGELAEE